MIIKFISKDFMRFLPETLARICNMTVDAERKPELMNQLALKHCVWKHCALKQWLVVCSMLGVLTGCDSGEKVDVNDSGSNAKVVEDDRDRQADLLQNQNVDVAKPFDEQEEISRAMQLSKEGRHQEAAQRLQQVLLANPSNVEVLFRLALTQAELGDFDSAVELLDSIPEDSEAGLAAIGQSADWCLMLGKYNQAEKRYRRVLNLVPSAIVAHRQLAFLYNRQGRRHEAVVHLQELCRLGDIRQDELHALLVVGHAIFEDPNNPDPSDAPRHYWPIGPVAEARMLYTANRYSDAIAALDETVRDGDVLPSVMAFYGLLAIEAQDEPRFQWWLANCDQAVEGFSEYWAAIGASLVGKREFDQAVYALLRAIDLDPTDLASMRRVNQSLQALNRDEEAERWVERYVTQRSATLASNAIGEAIEVDPSDFETVADNLEKLGRPLEAVTWRVFGAFYRKESEQRLTELNQIRRDLASAENAFPDESIRLEEMNLAEFKRPLLDSLSDQTVPFPSKETSAKESYPKPTFENVATAVGVDHTFWVSSQPQSFRFALYQSLGGGAAAIDYDLDGQTDLYLAQGGTEPPAMLAEVSNMFYRQVDGQVRQVAKETGTEEFLYTVGVTAGDWNQDGFQDIVLANIGNKVLLINNGDGTFSRQVFDVDPENANLISSVAIGDLSGDALPDLVSLYYVEDPAMLERPELGADGNVLTVSPASFNPGLDRLTVNDGMGGFETSRISESSGDASTGLGVVIADWDGKPGNEIFIGNDVRANHLWVRRSEDETWGEIAALTGCAHGHGGIATASMGIAVADYDGSGTLDIHIANFYQEPVSFYLNRGGSFEDRAIQYKLHQPSLSVLGFGCQALDYNNDGRSDLAVTNGNIEKAPGEPLEQSPQFFVNSGSAFQLYDVDEPRNYWQGKYLGRGMGRLDFNRDGKMDLVITHLGSPTALLLNQTSSNSNWLQLELVGTRSERDAIGAKVMIEREGRILTEWLVGGDGYLCRNEPILHFGLDDSKEVTTITVSWPNGESESFGGCTANQRLVLIEGSSQSGTFAR